MAKISDVEIPSLLFTEGAAPSAPASGFGRLYVKTTGLHFKGDDGVEIGPLAAAGAAAGAWTAYTPAWTADSVNPTIGNGSIVGAWLQDGKTLFVRAVITMGTTTTYGTGGWSVGLPAGKTAKTGSVRQIGSAFMIDMAPTLQLIPGICRVDGGATAFRVNSATVTTGNVAAALPFTWASTDELDLSITLEVD